MSRFLQRFSIFPRAGSARGRLAVVSALVVLAALAPGLIMPRSTHAGMVFQAVNSIASAGGTGSFDVVLTNTGGSFQVSLFSVELSVAAGSGITFTGASITTTPPYLFGSLQSPPLVFQSFPRTDFTASDASMTSPFFVTLSTLNQSVGLEHVTYAVAPGTRPGVIPVSIVIGSNTQLLDLPGNIVPSTATNGSITVAGPALPEPSSLVMGLIAAASLTVVRRVWVESLMCRPSSPSR